MKANQLDTARGIASIVVIFHHFALAFLPGFKDAVHATPAYVFVNGSGAVSFFFCLSGYVLSVGLLKKNSILEICLALTKRFPRLYLPVAVSIIFGAICIILKISFHLEASSITGSKWLEDLGNSLMPLGHSPSFLDAIRQTFGVFFYKNDFYYNSNLWTMRFELFGSILTFFIIAILIHLKSSKSVYLFLLTASSFFWVFIPKLIPFIIGVMFAIIATRQRPKLPFAVGFFLLSIGLALNCVNREDAELVGNSMILATLLWCDRIALALTGRFGTMIGAFSFPIYMTHSVIIFTLSSFIFFYFNNIIPFYANITITFVATLAGATLSAAPLVKLDAWWVKIVGTTSAKIMKWVAPQTATIPSQNT